MLKFLGVGSAAAGAVSARDGIAATSSALGGPGEARAKT
jgi:hypothetical protein